MVAAPFCIILQGVVSVQGPNPAIYSWPVRRADYTRLLDWRTNTLTKRIENERKMQMLEAAEAEEEGDEAARRDPAATKRSDESKKILTPKKLIEINNDAQEPLTLEMLKDVKLSSTERRNLRSIETYDQWTWFVETG